MVSNVHKNIPFWVVVHSIKNIRLGLGGSVLVVRSSGFWFIVTIIRVTKFDSLINYILKKMQLNFCLSLSHFFSRQMSLKTFNILE